MIDRRIGAVSLVMALLLGGCDFADNALLPALSGSAGGTPASGSATYAPPGPRLGTTSFQAEAPVAIKPTGTPAGEATKIIYDNLVKLQASLKTQNDTLQQLRAQSAQSVQAYNTIVASINTKLDVGTTPGNSNLTSQWADANAQLAKGDQTLAQMNKLSTDVASSVSVADYLLQSSQSASGIAGAVDLDRSQLRVLQDEVNKTSVLSHRLLAELTDDTNRQSYYLTQQRSYMNALSIAVSHGEPVGVSVASRTNAQPQSPPLPPGSGAATGRPLVVIRFDQPNPDYQQALSQAVSLALARRPNAAFDLVGVSPRSDGSAQRNANQVMDTLRGLGLTADRVSMSTRVDPNAPTNEVNLYIR